MFADQENVGNTSLLGPLFDICFDENSAADF